MTKRTKKTTAPAAAETDVVAAAILEELNEAIVEAEDTSGKDEAPVQDYAGKRNEILADDELIEHGRAGVASAFDERSALERAKGSANIFKSLDKSRAKMIEARCVAALLAADATPDFVSRSTREGSAFNVYAIEKVADFVQALGSDEGVIRNAINRAVMKSLFQFRAAGEAFTGDMSRAAASDKIRVQGQIAKLLVRHTVSQSTAPTQASSTISALVALGAVKNTGTMRAPVYELTDAPIVAQLEKLAKAA